MSQTRKVYLIGFMGSGKTTAGRRLAGMLGWDFADLDSLIERELGLPVAGIFEKYGEDYFRKKEMEELLKLEEAGNVIVATGGGAPCFGENMEFMLRTGLTVYLRLTPGQLKSRLAHTRGERPLLKDLGEHGLLKFIEERLEQREKWYSRADLIVDGFDPDLRSLSALVLSRLNI